jgi:hypothetical protein
VSYGLPQSLSRQWRETSKVVFRSLGVTLRGDAQPPFLLSSEAKISWEFQLSFAS